MDQSRSRPLSRDITVPQRLLVDGGHQVHFNNTNASRALCGAYPLFGEPSLCVRRCGSCVFSPERFHEEEGKKKKEERKKKKKHGLRNYCGNNIKSSDSKIDRNFSGFFCFL